MLRKLLIVFASGIALSIVAFSLAWLVGGSQFRQEFIDHGGWHWNIGDDDDHGGPRKTRQFAIEPGMQLAMEVPVDMEFARGDKAAMTVEGDARDVDRLVFENGRLSMKGEDNHHWHHGLKVRIVAPQIGGLDFKAPGDVTLAGLDQDELRLASEGAIDLEASGKVKRLFVDNHGAGNFDLGKLDAEDARVELNGAGNITIAAVGDVRVVLNGIGNVSLEKKPRSLNTQINGLGSIDHDY